MLLINPTTAEAMPLLSTDISPVTLTCSPGGRVIALSNDDQRGIMMATETHVGLVVPNGRMYHDRKYRGPVIEWQRPSKHYALAYNDTLKCWQVAVAADEYALPADHNPIPDGYGALLVMVYTRSKTRVGGPDNGGHTLHRLNLPHTLDGIPDMFQTDEE